MRLDYLFKLFIVFAFCGLHNYLYPQKIASPLQPQEAPIQRELGVVVGLGQNLESGEIITPCDCPSFKDGIRFGYHFGVLYEQDFSPAIQWGAELLYDYRGIKNSYQQYELITAQETTTGELVSARVLTRQSANVDFSYLTIMPYLKWSPWDFIFFKLGLSPSFLVSSHINHTKELLTTSIRLNNGQVVSLGFYPSGQTTQAILDSTYPDVKTFQFDINPMIAFNFNLSQNIFVSPGFEYTIPLTQLASAGNGLKVSDWRVFVEIRLGLTLRTMFE